MKTFTLRSGLFLLCFSVVLRASAQTAFYGGDFDGRDAIASERNTSVSDSRVYDDFSLGGAMNVTGFFGSFLATSPAAITGLHYEIRRGIVAGSGGTLLASGNVAATVFNTGTQALNLNLLTVTSAPVNFNLASGTYFLSLAAIGNGTGSAYLATASGDRGVGSPLNNGNSFIDSTSFGFNFDSVADDFGTAYDFSQGITARPVPEPATMASLALGTLVLVRRRRRS